MANSKAESNALTLGKLLTSKKYKDPLKEVLTNLPVESLLNLRLTNEYLKTAVNNFIIQKLEQEFPVELKRLGENPIISKILHLYTTLIECKEYFSKLSNSDSDKILKTHCLAYLICKYPSNTKPKDYFIENGADLNAAEELLQSLKAEEDLNLYLNHTFTWDSLYLLKTVLSMGADFGNALRREAETGHTKRVKLLLAADKQTKAVNAKDYYGWTALLKAAVDRHTGIVKVLLAHKDILVNATNNYGLTALMLAAGEGHTEIVQALLAHKDIDVNADKFGRTALMLAAEKGHTGIVKALLAHKDIDVNAENKNGYTALMFAACNGRTEAVKVLLTYDKIDVNAKDNNGCTALMRAAEKGHTGIVKALLAHKDILVNDKNNGGGTALMLAVLNRHTGIVKALLAHKDILVNDKEDNDGQTALMFAASRHISIVKALLAHKDIEVNAENSHNKTARDYARIAGHTEIEELLAAKTPAENSITEPNLYPSHVITHGYSQLQQCNRTDHNDISVDSIDRDIKWRR